MSRARIKEGKKNERGKLPDDASRLLEIIIAEMQSPVDMQKLLEQMPPLPNCSEEAFGFLMIKDRAQRREAFIKSEPMWYGKYGWFMARIVGLFGIIVLIVSLLMRGAGADFIISMILGAACYYMLLVTLSNMRYSAKNQKRLKMLEAESDRYQQSIVQIASALLKRFHIDPRRFPIANPRSSAGLDHLEGKFFIPIE